MHFGVEECKFICWRKDTKYGKSLTKALTEDEQGKKNMVYDAKFKDLIISGLIESVYLKVFELQNC